jgi:hypothetical protein
MLAVSQRHAAGNGMPRPSATSFHAHRSWNMATLVAGIAVLSVAIECPVAATVFGALAFYAVGHIA